MRKHGVDTNMMYVKVDKDEEGKRCRNAVRVCSLAHFEYSVGGNYVRTLKPIPITGPSRPSVDD